MAVEMEDEKNTKLRLIDFHINFKIFSFDWTVMLGNQFPWVSHIVETNLIKIGARETHEFDRRLNWAMSEENVHGNLDITCYKIIEKTVVQVYHRRKNFILSLKNHFNHKIKLYVLLIHLLDNTTYKNILGTLKSIFTIK